MYRHVGSPDTESQSCRGEIEREIKIKIEIKITTHFSVPEIGLVSSKSNLDLRQQSLIEKPNSQHNSGNTVRDSVSTPERRGGRSAPAIFSDGQGQDSHE